MSDTLQKAEILAKKLDGLNAHFDIVESTIDECTEYVQSLESTTFNENSKDINGGINEGDYLDEHSLLLMLRNDFMSVRETLIDTIKSGKTVVTSVNAKLTTFDDDIGNAEMIGAFATLIKVVNDSSKLLINLYGDIIKTHQLLEKNKKEKEINIEGDLTINTIAGNINDIIRQIKAN